jgi:membrane protein required for colicin V production
MVGGDAPLAASHRGAACGFALLRGVLYRKSITKPRSERGRRIAGLSQSSQVRGDSPALPFVECAGVDILLGAAWTRRLDNPQILKSEIRNPKWIPACAGMTCPTPDPRPLAPAMSWLQPYDVLMAFVLVGTTVFGAWKGMAWQLAALASIVVSAGVAVHGSRPLAAWFGWTEPWNRALAMLILYLVTSLAIWLAFRAVAGFIDRVKLREFDRQMGALFGLAKGALLCAVITFFAVTLFETSRQLVLKSRSGDWIARGTRHASLILPDEIRLAVGKYIDEMDERLREDRDVEQPLEDLPNSEQLRREILPLHDNLTEAADRLDGAVREAERLLDRGVTGQGG